MEGYDGELENKGLLLVMPFQAKQFESFTGLHTWNSVLGERLEILGSFCMFLFSNFGLVID